MTQPSRRPFGTTPGGQPVELLILDNGTLRCELLTLGATLRTLEVPGRNGSRVDVVLGYDAQEDYLTYGGYLGAVVGRFANRIARGRFSLNGKEYTLAVNDGPNHLHGGLVGFSHRGWQVEELTDDRAVLSLTSPDGEEGYPGTLTARVTYRLDGSALELRYEAVSDKDTPCSLTNHSYFNLAGHASGRCWTRKSASTPRAIPPPMGPASPWARWSRWRAPPWTCAPQLLSVLTSRMILPNCARPEVMTTTTWWRGSRVPCGLRLGPAPPGQALS